MRVWSSPWLPVLCKKGIKVILRGKTTESFLSYPNVQMRLFTWGTSTKKSSRPSYGNSFCRQVPSVSESPNSRENRRRRAFSAVNVHIPKDRITNVHQGYGFVEFLSEEDADYAMKIMNMIKMFGKPIRVNKARENRADNERFWEKLSPFLGVSPSKKFGRGSEFIYREFGLGSRREDAL